MTQRCFVPTTLRYIFKLNGIFDINASTATIFSKQSTQNGVIFENVLRLASIRYAQVTNHISST